MTHAKCIYQQVGAVSFFATEIDRLLFPFGKTAERGKLLQHVLIVGIKLQLRQVAVVEH